MDINQYYLIYAGTDKVLENYMLIPARNEAEDTKAMKIVSDLLTKHEKVGYCAVFYGGINSAFIEAVILNLMIFASSNTTVPYHIYSDIINDLSKLGFILEPQKDKEVLDQQIAFNEDKPSVKDSYTKISEDMEVIRSAKTLVKKHYLDDLSTVNKRVLENAIIALDEVLAGLNKSRNRFDK